MARGNIIARFENVTFGYGPKKPVLHEVSFTLRTGAKLTLMGQNGAGKTSLFKLITGSLAPESGAIHSEPNITIATAPQVISRGQMQFTVREFFQACFPNKVYDIDPRIDAVLETVNLKAGHDRLISSFSGGQQARLLLASALIQNPDLLLLDEPTNNLDAAGIAHLRQFLIDYPKTCVVISHDANFLNAFTKGVLYLDSFTHQIEQYVGNYFAVVDQIAARIEKEQRKNAQLLKTIQEKKEQANKFAFKGGQMRLVATRMREKAEELEEAMVDVRRDDKTIRPFVIPVQEDLVGAIIRITAVSAMRDDAPHSYPANIELGKNQHLAITGPNGIGKSTLVKALAAGTAPGAAVAPGVRVGYYGQDFSTLDFSKTVYATLAEVMSEPDEQKLRSVAAGFLITGELMQNRIESLSEGQKGLLSFARLVLQKPGLLLLDEPTNHINFRHIPVIAQALDQYAGAMILISHVPDFLKSIRIDDYLDLAAYAHR
ncbi:ABC transporter ATP-binding protein [Candidatus Parcubacteria bacterium]|nr:MAG: ABC transporter ATP-binding protein [Candidatus Parcubacteria bacterium]